ncbi:MAG TPA: polyhydroxyalkanoate synthesis regulator DNA-binding domain-containing protein [Terriglobales bacterium]|nr:polyhydroxyalkanoate synthesis regulator DNA-binding domain-containing protein [Terriglobales bacterium]
MRGEPVVIKKYSNRRLYDTFASRYINLEDIAALIRNGTVVQVVDAKTGEDLTRVTLTQIIVEDAKGQPHGLPVEFLRQLILATDRMGREFIMWYLKTAFDAYQKVQHAVQNRFSGIQSAALSPLETVKSFLHESGGNKRSTEEELLQLRKRITELEGQLKKTEVNPKRSAPSKRRKSNRRSTTPRLRKRRSA